MKKKGASTVDALRKHHKADKSHKQKTPRPSNEKCYKCLMEHPPRRCPAFGKKCLGCGKFNHFKKACRSEKNKKKLHQVEQEYTDESESDENDGHNFHIGEVTKKNDGQSESEWKVELKTKDKNTFKAKVDTGAQVNVMSLKEACRIGGQLNKCKDRLTSYSGDQIPVEGQIEIICEHKRQEKRIKFVVTSQREAQTILGLQSSIDLKLI